MGAHPHRKFVQCMDKYFSNLEDVEHTPFLFYWTFFVVFCKALYAYLFLLLALPPLIWSICEISHLSIVFIWVGRSLQFWRIIIRMFSICICIHFKPYPRAVLDAVLCMEIYSARGVRFVVAFVMYFGVHVSGSRYSPLPRQERTFYAVCHGPLFVCLFNCFKSRSFALSLGNQNETGGDKFRKRQSPHYLVSSILPVWCGSIGGISGLPLHGPASRERGVVGDERGCCRGWVQGYEHSMVASQEVRHEDLLFFVTQKLRTFSVRATEQNRSYIYTYKNTAKFACNAARASRQLGDFFVVVRSTYIFRCWILLCCSSALFSRFDGLTTFWGCRAELDIDRFQRLAGIICSEYMFSWKVQVHVLWSQHML